MKSSFIFLCIFVAILHLSEGGPLRLQKRAAFYIANETACVVDNTVYSNGDPIPTDDPCEACKCRPPGFACVLKECEVKPGCRAVRRAGHCCPEYICGCEHNGRMYRDGEEIRDTQNPCYTCHCQGSSIACAFFDCFFRVDCAPEYVPGECCPHYNHCIPLDPTIHNTPPVDNAYLFTNNAETSYQSTHLPSSTVQSSQEAYTHPTSQPISNPSFELFGAGGRDSIEQVKPTYINHDNDEKAILPAEENSYIGEPESETSGPKQTLTTQLQDNEKDTSLQTTHSEISKEDTSNPESQEQEIKNPHVLFKSDTELKHDEKKPTEISAAETTVEMKEQTVKPEDTSTSSVISTLKEETQTQTTIKSDLISDEAEAKPLTEQKDKNTEKPNSNSSQEVKNSAADNSKSLRFENEVTIAVTESSLEDEKEAKETKVDKPITTTDGILVNTETKMATEHSEVRAEEVKENKVTEVAKTTDTTEKISESEKENEDAKSSLNTDTTKILLEVSTVPVSEQSSSQNMLNTAAPHILPKDDEKGNASETVLNDTKIKEVFLHKADKEKLQPELAETVATISTIQKETIQPTNYETDTTTDNIIKRNTSPEDNLLKSLDDVTTAANDQKYKETTIQEENKKVEESKKISTEDEPITKFTSTEPDSKVDAKSRLVETDDISPSTEKKLEVTQTTQIHAEVSTEHTMQPGNEHIKEVTTEHGTLKANE